MTSSMGHSPFIWESRPAIQCQSRLYERPSHYLILKSGVQGDMDEFRDCEEYGGAT